MSLTVVGSIAFDSVRTPFGERERMLGRLGRPFRARGELLHRGRTSSARSATTSATSTSSCSRSRGVDVDDVERVAGGETFFWRGHYEDDMNVAHTDDTQLGVFADFEPKLSEASQHADVLFLGNIQPDLQRQVRAQCNGARLAALDSMNLWIETTRDSLVAAIGEVDCLLLNDAEIRMLTEEPNLARAARAVMEMGPRIVVAKRGEYGAVLFTPRWLLRPPGLPARGRPRPDRRRRQLRRRLPRLPRHAGRPTSPTTRPAPGDGLRHGARLVQRRGVRHRASRAPDRGRDRGALRRAAGMTHFESRLTGRRRARGQRRIATSGDGQQDQRGRQRLERAVERRGEARRRQLACRCRRRAAARRSPRRSAGAARAPGSRAAAARR